HVRQERVNDDAHALAEIGFKCDSERRGVGIRAVDDGAARSLKSLDHELNEWLAIPAIDSVLSHPARTHNPDPTAQLPFLHRSLKRLRSRERRIHHPHYTPLAATVTRIGGR